MGRCTGCASTTPTGCSTPAATSSDFKKGTSSTRPAGWAGIAADDPDWPALRAALAGRWRQEVEGDPASPLRKALYLVVEKIQGGRERIPEDWAVHGTTGYRFANLITGLLVDAAAERELTDAYHRFIGQPLDLAALVVEKKKQVMAVAMASEINGLARELNRISEMNRRTRDFTLNSIRRALIGFIAHFPVYRTYVSGANGVDERDAHYIRWTVARARAADPTTNASLFQWLEDVLLKRYPDHLPAPEREVMLRFAMKLQQLTGPVMAKGLEDTVFYVYNRLVALNEVGGEPEHFGTGVETFHQRNLERARGWPGALVASTTHDTKRSEDVRARLAVLTEVPGEWRRAVETWARLNAPHKTAVGEETAPVRQRRVPLLPDAARRLADGGAGPGGDRWPSATGSGRTWPRPSGRRRSTPAGPTPTPTTRRPPPASWSGRWTPASPVPSWSRRAGSRSGWSAPARSTRWPRSTLKLISPGVPDLYQGTELWDLSLVDPDNRRPVDFALRETAALRALPAARPGDRQTRGPGDLDPPGRRALQAAPHLAAAPPPPVAPRPLPRRRVRGAGGGGHRRAAHRGLPPGAAAIGGGGGGSPAGAPGAPGSGLGPVYGSTRVRLPPLLAGRRFRHVVTGAAVAPVEGGLAVGPLLTDFPVAVLEAVE